MTNDEFDLWRGVVFAGFPLAENLFDPERHGVDVCTTRRKQWFNLLSQYSYDECEYAFERLYESTDIKTWDLNEIPRMVRSEVLRFRAERRKLNEQREKERENERLRQEALNDRKKHKKGSHLAALKWLEAGGSPDDPEYHQFFGDHW